MAQKRRKKSKKPNSSIDPGYLTKQRALLRRDSRKTVLFNKQELAAIDEYCRRFKVSSRSALMREALMEKVLAGLNENHPTLF